VLHGSGFSIEDVAVHAITVMAVNSRGSTCRLSATNHAAIRSCGKWNGEEKAGQNAFSGQLRKLWRPSSGKCLLAT
jgi:hypothetical protein